MNTKQARPARLLRSSMLVSLPLLAMLTPRGGLAQQVPGKDIAWPPKVGEKYPDLKLIDQNGSRVSLSTFRGKIILLETVAMS